MRTLFLAMLSAAAFFEGGAARAQSDRASADIACSPTDRKLAYDCTITIRRAQSKQPMEGLKVVVRADMPSMPMAHTMRPVTAVPAGEPGSYAARLELEMVGDWAVRVDITGPTRDQIIQVLRFEQGSISVPLPRIPRSR